MRMGHEQSMPLVEHAVVYEHASAIAVRRIQGGSVGRRTYPSGAPVRRVQGAVPKRVRRVSVCTASGNRRLFMTMDFGDSPLSSRRHRQ